MSFVLNIPRLNVQQPQLSILPQQQVSTVDTRGITDDMGVSVASSIDNPPRQGKWHFAPIFKDSMIGKPMIWVVGFNGVDSIMVKHGYVDGAIQTPPYEIVVLNTSGRDMYQQSLLEIRERYKKKYDMGYRPVGGDKSTKINPMLATDIKKSPIKKWPVATQAKLDGVRAIAREVSDGKGGLRIEFRSRLGNEFTFLNHLRADIQEFLAYLPPGSALDGELYSHVISPQLILGMVKATKQAHAQIGRIEYYIFDIITPQNDLPYEKRYQVLTEGYKRYNDRSIDSSGARESILRDALIPFIIKDLIGIVSSYIVAPHYKFFPLTVSVAFNMDDIERFHNSFVALGYEGIMIKKISNTGPTFPYLPNNGATAADIKSASYRFGRTTNMLKYKHFQDAEGTVIGYEEGSGIWRGTPIFILRDAKGTVFKANPKGSVDERRKMFTDINRIIGKMVTYRYQELSQEGVPRFPVALHIRDYE